MIMIYSAANFVKDKYLLTIPFSADNWSALYDNSFIVDLLSHPLGNPSLRLFSEHIEDNYHVTV